MTTDKVHRNSFVHNCLENKSKVNLDHFYKIYSNKVLNTRKKKILEIMHATKVDFRMLTAFKNALFDSEELVENHLVPLQVWKDTLIIEMQYCLSPAEDLIM